MSVQELGERRESTGIIKFKYNHCVGSRIEVPSKLKRLYTFKYNHCVGSSVMDSLNGIAYKEFKYNHCVGSSQT